MSNNTKIYITNGELCEMLTQLCGQILSIKDCFDHIVGIERGGIPISSWLSYVLGKQHHSIWISRYGDKENPSNSFNFKIPDLPTTPFLLVDDIIDSGETLKFFKNLKHPSMPNFWVATLHWCEENSPDSKPDFYIQKKKMEEWIVYPWEKS